MKNTKKSFLRYGNTDREQRTNNCIQYNAKIKKKQGRVWLIKWLAWQLIGTAGVIAAGLLLMYINHVIGGAI